jgi:hypothetical protein
MSPDEVKWVTFLSISFILLYVGLLGHFLIVNLKDESKSNSLEGENQDVNP